MKRALSCLCLLLGICLVLSSCAQYLKSESGLYGVPLKHTYKSAVDGGWIHEGPNPYAHQKQGYIYVAPLDVSRIAKKHQHLAPLLVEQMHHYMQDELSKGLAQVNTKRHSNWQLTKAPTQAQVRIDMAVVKFRPQHPVLRVISAAAGAFIEIPGVTGAAGYFSQGAIVIEATIRDTKNQQLFLAIKDSNRKRAQLYQANAYKATGLADSSLRNWALRLAHLFNDIEFDKYGHSNARERVQQRGFKDIVKDHFL